MEMSASVTCRLYICNFPLFGLRFSSLHHFFFFFSFSFQSSFVCVLKITVDTICVHGNGPLTGGLHSRSFPPHWPSVECDLPACPACRHVRLALGVSFALRLLRYRPCKSNSPGWLQVQGCDEQRPGQLCPSIRQL